MVGKSNKNKENATVGKKLSSQARTAGLYSINGRKKCRYCVRVRSVVNDAMMDNGTVQKKTSSSTAKCTNIPRQRLCAALMVNACHLMSRGSGAGTMSSAIECTSRGVDN